MYVSLEEALDGGDDVHSLTNQSQETCRGESLGLFVVPDIPLAAMFQLLSQGIMLFPKKWSTRWSSGLASWRMLRFMVLKLDVKSPPWHLSITSMFLSISRLSRAGVLSLRIDVPSRNNFLAPVSPVLTESAQ